MATVKYRGFIGLQRYRSSSVARDMGENENTLHATQASDTKKVPAARVLYEHAVRVKLLDSV